MARQIPTIILILLTPLSIVLAGNRFDGAGGFSTMISKPDFGQINQELKALGMPEFNEALIMYGGQGFGEVSNRFRIGGMGFGGSISVNDYKNGYARQATLSMGWGGVLLEYVIADPGNFELFGGGTLGWGGLRVHLQKSRTAENWNGLWENYQAAPDTADNISTDMTHSFYIVQPRFGVRYRFIDWMAISGSIEVPLTRISGNGWRVNDQRVYNAPSLDLTAPVFHISLLFGG
jgi:hypothetical protein